jgi:hypothetical protein
MADELDGFLALIPVWSETHTRLIFNPRLVLTQKAKNSNINLMNKIKNFLESFLNVDVLLPSSSSWKLYF